MNDEFGGTMKHRAIQVCWQHAIEIPDSYRKDFCGLIRSREQCKGEKGGFNQSCPLGR